jgi:prepilin-type N-terminal cleavage/methylation domain-containing protein
MAALPEFPDAADSASGMPLPCNPVSNALRRTQRAPRGFTLIEVAIVLVVIGLLLGGVLKGQELITAARVRNIIKQQDDIKTAYYGFVDRFRLPPGDYNAATAHIPNISTAACNGGNGDANAKVETTNNENTLLWEHLSKSGFLNGSYTCAATVSPQTTPMNAYSQYLDLVYDASYAGASPTARHNLKTGGQVAPDMLGTVDRKIDDGDALRGSFRGSVPATVDPATCWNTTSGQWLVEGGGSNCGGAALL